MSLSTYRQKRNFKETPEPGAEVSKSKAANSFVIQRHDASRLHYDFRLEVNGVLKSWAIPKGPSLNPDDKRLAVMVEDHPLSYGKFKGKIPEGNYGAGLVEIWDRGTYTPDEIEKVTDKEIDKHIKKGMLKFTLKGRKLKGSFALVRIYGSESKNWLLIKHRDEYATNKAFDSEALTADNSPINKARKKEAASTNGASKKTVVKKKALKKTPGKKTATKKGVVKKAAPKNSISRKTAVKKKSAKKSAAPKNNVSTGHKAKPGSVKKK